ncbi:HEAT repeat domain-containing protein [Paenibacillus methanolicus]|uniref:HEAT repeat protein n=1 Tax=Paenibacillus methanolicus TaxID=582686 RepID=A0A5S5CI12_9BACL|nr:HEAT repeat domain-containing protein [Paenibacillus methanolicus]TYP79429.1 HEAT repeat protein [Paenibacillus methanolicus]
MKKPIFMFSKDKEYASVDYMVTDPTQRELCYRMIDSIIEINAQNYLSDALLEPFITAMKTNYKYVVDVAGGRLAQLTYHYPEAKQVFFNLIHDSNSKVRFNILTALIDKPHEDVIPCLLKAALKDKSVKVRSKVADITFRLSRADMIPILEDHLKTENNPKVVESIRFTIENFGRFTYE